MKKNDSTLTRRDFTRNILAGLGGAMIAPQLAAAIAGPDGEQKPNVLLIAVDDLRTELGCYGSQLAKTPHLDRFAQSGVLFERHYSQFAICIPSRAALLTSLRPERTHQTYGPTVWDRVPGVRTWGNVFHDAGYATVSLGKVWHLIGKGTKPDRFDVDTPNTGGGYYGDPKNQQLFDQLVQDRMDDKPGAGGRLAGEPPIVEAYDAPDEAYLDGTLATEAIAQLSRLKAGDQPFMLAVGFHKPHVPHAAPKRYWDLYDRDRLPLSPEPNFPEDTPDLAWDGNYNYHNYSCGARPPLPKGNVRTEVMPEACAREIRHGYLACVSFVDAQIGRVLDALDREGLDRNTIVVFWTDHGYHLGDLNQWGKQTDFETAAHTPLIVRVPGLTPAGRHSQSIVESVDVLPTLLDLCGIAPLALTDGCSFTRVLRRPDTPWKDAAFQVTNRGILPPSADIASATRELAIGHAVRTATHRYVEWRVGWSLAGELVAAELYDYTHGSYETRNLADDPAQAELRRTLALRLHAGPAGVPA